MTKSIGVFEPAGELTPEMLRGVLGLVSLDVPEAVIGRWTENERRLAYDYAIRVHYHASDNNSVRLRDCPWFVKISALPVDDESIAEWDALAQKLQADAGITDREAFIASIATTAITMLRQHLAAQAPAGSTAE